VTTSTTTPPPLYAGPAHRGADPRSALARQRTIDALKGEIPSPINPPSGCTFRTRCRYALPICAQQRPPLENTGVRNVACHRWQELDLKPGA
jgi:oligopeptide transport system ATP-binding protein